MHEELEALKEPPSAGLDPLDEGATTPGEQKTMTKVPL